MKIWRFVLGVILLIALLGGWLAWDYGSRFFKPNVNLSVSSVEFYIKSDWQYREVFQALHAQGIIDDTLAFDWVANYKNYPPLVKAGRYVILDGMNNNALVNLLRSGEQEPIRLVLRSVRSMERLAGNVSQYIEADSAGLLALLRDETFCQRYGFNTTTILTMFLPNTYEFYWNTTSEEFVERMAREYKRFWNDERKGKAGKIGLSQSQVSILASLVQAEQAAHRDERPKVAGLYLNRLKKGTRLESDPTLIHALGDYTIKRVLNVHKQVESPYNTYKYKGLPPGPILLPERASIDAVLDAEDHNYIFMCAKDDFSGYHHFATTYREHLKNAHKYQRALNSRKIYR